MEPCLANTHKRASADSPERQQPPALRFCRWEPVPHALDSLQSAPAHRWRARSPRSRRTRTRSRWRGTPARVQAVWYRRKAETTLVELYSGPREHDAVGEDSSPPLAGLSPLPCVSRAGCHHRLWREGGLHGLGWQGATCESSGARSWDRAGAHDSLR